MMEESAIARETREYREAIFSEKIKAEYHVRDFPWDWHSVLTFPRGKKHKDPDWIRSKVKQWLKDVSFTTRTRLGALCAIVIKHPSPPHVHCLMASLPTPTTNNLIDADPRAAVSLWRPWKAKIKTANRWNADGRTATSNYVFNHNNLNVDPFINIDTEIFFFNKPNLLKLI